MSDLIQKTPEEVYNEIIQKLDESKNYINKNGEVQDPIAFENLIISCKYKIVEFTKEINNIIKQNEQLGFNLKLLNNYYKFLLTRAFEDKDLDAIAELKYHLKELVAAWQNR
jgi:flagellin-specific chaperone FliS